MTNANAQCVPIETKALADYLAQAVRDWTSDYDVRIPDPLQAALMMLAASLKGYADEPTRDLLAQLLASAAGVSGQLADMYQFPGDAEKYNGE